MNKIPRSLLRGVFIFFKRKHIPANSCGESSPFKF